MFLARLRPVRRLRGRDFERGHHRQRAFDDPATTPTAPGTRSRSAEGSLRETEMERMSELLYETLTLI